MGFARRIRADFDRPATSDNAPYVVFEVRKTRVSGVFCSGLWFRDARDRWVLVI